MHASHFHYLPLTFPFFSILIAIFILIAAFIQIGILRYAYLRLGLSPSAALLVLAGSLIGSYFNIPVAELPERQIVSGEVVDFFGMRYVVPYLAERPETIVAVNVGGALIPGAMSIYLLFQHQLWLRGLIGTACVAAICFFLAQPVPGLGIALPIFVPAAATAVISLLLSWQNAAPLAYISGSLGPLIGADLLNLPRIQGLGAPVVSIGGAGTFDGIFLTGILAVLLASFTSGWGRFAPGGRAR
jgi:uncharacterized membrane protein